MSKIIMGCSSLRKHIDAAQEKEGTHYPVIELDSRLHAEPKDMRTAIFSQLQVLPADTEVVMLAMGLCGGSVSDLPLPVDLVMPRVDDCITLLMHVDDAWHPNLKEGGHLYLTDTVDGNLSVENIRKRLIERYGEKKGLMVFDIWFDSYSSVDIIDTGIYDCRDPLYLEAAKRNADLIACPLRYVDGSNILLEKLVSGRWDHQFLTAKKGQVLREEDFI